VHYHGVVAYSQTDFTEDLKKITVPVLVMHGDNDQIVAYAGSAPLSAKLLRNSTLKTYKGFPHGMPTTNADQINSDLLAFLKDQRIAMGVYLALFPNDASWCISFGTTTTEKLVSSSPGETRKPDKWVPVPSQEA
jgi:hypothetical protein